MSKIIDTIMGDLGEKKEYRENEKRAAALPTAYAKAYKEIKRYIFSTSGIVTIQPLVSLVDILEEAAANNQEVTDVTGINVAAFADELVRGERSYKSAQAQKLNDKFGK